MRHAHTYRAARRNAVRPDFFRMVRFGPVARYEPYIRGSWHKHQPIMNYNVMPSPGASFIMGGAR